MNARPLNPRGLRLRGAALLAVCAIIAWPHAAAAEHPETQPTNHWLPAVEILGLNILLNRTARLYGAGFAKISLASATDNVSGRWEFDNDAFTTNQLRHPYMGASFFTAARSTGVGFWGSSVYAFMGSLVWELFMEVERPSINDQISTPLGGVILGEASFRLSRAVLNRSSRWWRRGLAGLLDPLGSFNQQVLGYRTGGQRVRSYAIVGAGLNTVGEHNLAPGGWRARAFSQAHLRMAVSYGLPSDPNYQPRAPLDHLDVAAELNASQQEVYGGVFVRGLVSGRRIDRGRMRGIWGLYTSYDFFNPRRYRVGAVAVGAGSSVHLPLGTRGFVQGTGIVSAVPFGAAGATGSTARNYHWGPGLAQLLELRIGRARTGMLTLTARGYELLGTVFDDGSELINHTTLGGLINVSGRHAIGAELATSVRHASFADRPIGLTDTGAQLRVFYAFSSGSSPID